MSVTVSIIPSPENEPHDLMIEVDGQHIALTVDDARKLRDALCVMRGATRPRARNENPTRPIPGVVTQCATSNIQPLACA